MIVDPKVVACFTETHVAQMIGYLSITGLELALLINFKNARLEWKRVLRPNNPRNACHLICVPDLSIRAIRVIRGSLLLNMAKAIDWLKANYDRAVLMAAALFLFISALVIWWSAIQFGNRLVPPPRVPPKTASQPPSQSSSMAPPSSFRNLSNGNPARARGFSFRKNISSGPTACRRR